MQTFTQGQAVEVYDTRSSCGAWVPAWYWELTGVGHACDTLEGRGCWADDQVRPYPAVVQKIHGARTSAERKAQPIATGVLAYFPRTLAALSEVSRRGNDKHNPGEPLHHALEKSTDEADCCLRHIVDALEADKLGHPGGVMALNEDGSPHLMAALWRLSAWCERVLNGDERWRTVAK